MKKLILITIIMNLLLMQMISADTLKVGDLKVEYDNVLEEDTEWGYMKSYYLDDELVFTTFDDNDDGKPDSWFGYKDNVNTIAMKDTTGNNKPDYLVEFDSDGEITKETKKEQINLGMLIDKIIGNKVLVGSLILIVLLFLFFKRKKKHKKHKEEKHKK